MWPCFEVILRGYAKLEDVQTKWSRTDVLQMLSASYAWNEAEAEAMEAARRAK